MAVKCGLCADGGNVATMSRVPAFVLVATLAVACGQAAGDPVATTPPRATPATTPSLESPAPTSSVASTTQTPPSPVTAPPPSTTSASTLPLADIRLELTTVADGLGFPVQVIAAGGDERLFVVLKEGRVVVGEPGGEFSTYLDITDRVRDRGEQGLLAAAFHPAYPDEGRLFVHYSASDGDTVLASYAATTGGADASEEMVLYTTEQPAGNHNGGMIQFGPDGYLYLGLGDGGAANDRFGNGQNVASPLGGIVRFDVDGPVLVPFESVGGWLAELWAVGLRNPWRFWIDGDLIYVADVGQNSYEEISVAPFEEGHNFGWPITEGLHCFSPRTGCDVTGLSLPVLEVAHGDAGTCSITGGVVYRGSDIDGLAGTYLYSDFCGGYLRGLRVTGDGVELGDFTAAIGGSLGPVTGFGVDGAHEVYVTMADGRVVRIEG